MTVTVSDIRAKYDAPETAWQGSVDGYCVGGAFCMFLGEVGGPAHYPTMAHLAGALTEENPLLSFESAQDWAALIVHANERAEFERAWEHLASALAGAPLRPGMLAEDEQREREEADRQAAEDEAEPDDYESDDE